MLEVDNKGLEKGATLDVFLSKKKKPKAPAPKPSTNKNKKKGK